MAEIYGTSTGSSSLSTPALTISPNPGLGGGYTATSDPDVVERTQVAEIDLSRLVDNFLALKAEFQGLPDWEKTVPDAETLAYWNAEMEQLHLEHVHRIVIGARNLKNKIDPIRAAGLFPSKWEDEYNQLVNFINTYGT